MNNQNTNPGQAGTECGCKMCQKFGWCPAGKGRKIVKIVLWVIVIAFVVSFFVGGHEGWRNENKVVNTISFSGTGEVVVKPDIATVSLSSTAEDLDVSKATNLVNGYMADIINSLKSNGVAEKDIKTTNYSIYPRYNYGPVTQSFPYGGNQTLAAYVVTQSIELKIRDLTKTSQIISDLGKLKVSDMSGLTFTVDNDQVIKDQARDLAIKDAKSQAEVLAKSLGIELVRITSFSESGNNPIFYAMDKAVGLGAGAPSVAPQIPTGENKITSNVSITYEIR